MKTLFLTLITFMSAVISYAQSNNSETHYLGLPPDSIIYYQNMMMMVSSKTETMALYSAKPNDGGGFDLIYRNSYSHDNKIDYDYDVFIFDKRNVLTCHMIMLPATEEAEQIKNMQTDFYKINDHVLYHKKYNLKATIKTISNNGQDEAVFMYTRKEAEMP